MSRFTAVRLAAALAAVLAVAAAWWWHSAPADQPEQVPAPFQVTVKEWDTLLVGDAARTSDTYTALADVHPGLNDADARAAGQLAVDVVEADLTSEGRDAWPGYWPPPATTTTPPPVRCTGVSALAASATQFDVVGNSGRVTDWVKVLVPYAGQCGEVDYTSKYPGVEYVYLTREAGEEFSPVRDWQIPATEPDSDAGADDIAEWQLADIGPCGLADDTSYRARTLVAEAFARMCEAAAADDVVLVVESGYRSRADQQALFETAVEHYGSVERAKEWVAYADEDTCESKHCTGTALNIEPDYAATTWLNSVVGCAVAGPTGTTVTPAGDGGSCAEGTTPVKQSQMYGFVAPAPRIPGYLEFVLSTGTTDTAVADCTPSGQAVDRMVASVFRCRLQRVGVDPATTEAAVAEALVVSRCASSWNPEAQVFAGRYVDSPHPETGRYYTEAGVFALREELVETGWVDGSVTDPLTNIHAAASMWLATRGWEQFACATGTDPGLPAGPVLPAYGGPALPAWATGY